MYLVLYSALAQNANVSEQHHQARSTDTQPAMNALIHSLFLKPEGIGMLICSDLEHASGHGSIYSSVYSILLCIQANKAK